ncbi:DUF3386 domain-containing protein [Chamaesiphon minutus]|uniref:DUF3386 domain-containing protein n=1 Tax=Chamaesiphon minutus (strain ATCC 27169 / PCC 6605) TaxID=1173020 RepID=K9UKX3_CHAP6|nr:DUF3386 domain-containing protein [Chamaesiphon minutus]AFY95111.1 Protein of unknown function (DUF3386) [Chamaesiphon minutus PCC 6605]
MTETRSARDLFQAAYENRYTWEPNFPGYTATVEFKHGDLVLTGTVAVKANLSAEVAGIDDEEARKAILGQLNEVAIHRVRRTFESTHGKNTFSYGETDATGAVEILMGGKSEGDRYKLRNNEVCHVHRHIHGIVVTIDTFSSHDTGAGYLSHRYDSVYADPQTGEVKGGKIVFEDNYQKVGNYQILSQRIIQAEENGQPTTTEFNFTNIELLPDRVEAVAATV